MELKKVLVGIDGSPTSTAAQCWAADAVRDCGGEVIAIHVVAAPLVAQATNDVVHGLGMTDSALERALAESERLLEEQWCQPLRDAGVTYRTVSAKGDPVHELLHVARKEDVDVIVVGHQAESSFAHRLLRGNSDTLLDHARRPVVIVPYSKVASKVSASR